MSFFQFTNENVFCISIDSASERWHRIKRRAEQIGLPITRCQASTPSTLTNTFVDYLNNGQRACAQSHYNLWNHIVQHKLEYALILEDDACFDKQFFLKLNDFELYGQLHSNPNWDAIFLNASEIATPHHRWTKAFEQYLTAGYIVSYKGAKKLVSEWKHNPLCASDWMTSRLQLEGNCYTYFPWLIIQEGYDSTIGGHYVEDREKVVRCLQTVPYSIYNYTE